MFSGVTLAAEHLNWLWSFCTVKSIIGPCLGAVWSPSVQAPSSRKNKRNFSCLPSQVSAVSLTNSFVSLALSQPSFSLWLSVWTPLDAARPGNSLSLLWGCWPSLPFAVTFCRHRGKNVSYTSIATTVGPGRTDPCMWPTHLCLPHRAESLLWVGRGSDRESWVLLSISKLIKTAGIPTQWWSMCRDQV